MSYYAYQPGSDKHWLMQQQQQQWLMQQQQQWLMQQQQQQQYWYMQQQQQWIQQLQFSNYLRTQQQLVQDVKHSDFHDTKPEIKKETVVETVAAKPVATTIKVPQDQEPILPAITPIFPGTESEFPKFEPDPSFAYDFASINPPEQDYVSFSIPYDWQPTTVLNEIETEELFNEQFSEAEVQVAIGSLLAEM